MQGCRWQVRAGSGLCRFTQSASLWELHTTVRHTAPIPQEVEHSLQFPATQNTSPATDSLAIWLVSCVVSLQTGGAGPLGLGEVMVVGWTDSLTRPPEGFLEGCPALFFLLASVGFFSLTTRMVVAV